MSLNTSAVMVCPGGCRLFVRKSRRAHGHDERDAVCFDESVHPFLKFDINCFVLFFLVIYL